MDVVDSQSSPSSHVRLFEILFISVWFLGTKIWVCLVESVLRLLWHRTESSRDGFDFFFRDFYSFSLAICLAARLQGMRAGESQPIPTFKVVPAVSEIAF